MAGTPRTGRLPDIIIGGAPRSGTTYLCHALDRHPDIFMAKPFIPEPKVCLVRNDGGVAGRHARYAELFGEAEDAQTLIEKCANYFENAEAVETLKQTLTPKTGFLFILREPVERAFSNYLWSRQNGLEDLSFEEAVELEGKRESPLGPEREYARPHDYLTRGNYGAFAERYYAAFGKEKVKFVLFEDIAQNPARLYDGVQRFIGVEPLPADRFGTDSVNPVKDQDAAMESALIARLRERMKPFVEHFVAVTGMDVSVWGYDV